MLPNIEGYICLHRRTLASWPWTAPAPVFKAFVYLLLTAACADREIPDGKRTHSVKRGEVLNSLSAMADDLGVSSATMRKYIDRLVDEDFCVVEQVGTQLLRIRILNFERYQEAARTQPAGAVKPAQIVTPEPPKAAPQEEREVEPLGDLMSAARTRAEARQRYLTRQMRERGGARVISQIDKLALYEEQWKDARPEDWIQLYQFLHEWATGVGSPEVAAMGRRDVQKIRALVKRLTNRILPQVFAGPGSEYPHGLVAFYLIRELTFIKNKEAIVARKGEGFTRTPGLIELLTDQRKQHQWAVNFGRELRR